MHANVHSSIIYNSQDMQAAKCPSRDEWKKEDVRYTYTHTLWNTTPVIKNKEILPFTTT